MNSFFSTRELLWTLSQEELRYLERLLCNLEEPKLKPSADQTNEPGLCSPGLTNSNPHPSSCSSDSSNNVQLNPPATSIFNNISSINDLHHTSHNTRDPPSSRPSIFDMLSVTPPPDDAQGAPSESSSSEDGGNNNNADTQEQLPTLPQEQNPDQSNTVIINDQESGIARLIIGPPADEQVSERSSSTEQVRSSGHVAATVTPHSTEHIAQSDAHSSYSSLQEALQQFSFNLPTTHQNDTASTSPSHHVTIARSLSQDSPPVIEGDGTRPATGNVVRRCDTTSEESDSSESSSRLSDSDSSSSGPEAHNRFVPAHTIFYDLTQPCYNY